MTVVLHKIVFSLTAGKDQRCDMLKEMRETASEARQLGFSATANAMELFAELYVKPTRLLPPVEGGQKSRSVNQEDYLESERSGASAESCQSNIRRMSKRA